MSIKIGINGFGRIGRMVLRSIIENSRTDIEIVAINNRSNSEVSSFLLTHDTVHGFLKNKINYSDNLITIDEKKINKNDKINNPIDVLSPLNNTIVNATTTVSVIIKKYFLDKSELELYIIRNIKRGKNLAV